MLPCFLHTHNLPSIIILLSYQAKTTKKKKGTHSFLSLLISNSDKTHIPKSSLSFVGVAPMTSPSLCKKFKPQRIGEPYAGLLGLLVLIVVIIFCLFDLDYREVAKGLRFDTSMWSPLSREEEVKRVDFLGEEGDGCDLFHGDWVWDQMYPLYDSRGCRFLDDGFRCSENGRRDLLYTKWRWQPRTCNLPRFDAKLMLEKLRNKRMVFVGDSIGRNQWESLLCMLSSAVDSDKANSIYEVNGSPITKHKGYLAFRFKDFNCTVEYYRAPFLVLQSRPPAGSPYNIKTTLKLDEMDWSCAKWKDADFLVFNTGHWWNNEKTIRGGCYFQQGENVKLGMRVEDAYQKAMETVLQWIHSEVNTTKTQVFFRTFSPVHFRGGDWNTGGTCHMEKLPEMGSSLVPSHNWAQYKVAAEVLSSNISQAIKLNILDITQMASRRKDGHSSRYILGPGKGPAPINRQDCSHWCLPGVPDSWNELLFALILKREAYTTRSGKLSIGGADLAQE